MDQCKLITGWWWWGGRCPKDILVTIIIWATSVVCRHVREKQRSVADRLCINEKLGRSLVLMLFLLLCVIISGCCRRNNGNCNCVICDRCSSTSIRHARQIKRRYVRSLTRGYWSGWRPITGDFWTSWGRGWGGRGGGNHSSQPGPVIVVLTVGIFNLSFLSKSNSLAAAVVTWHGYI